MDVKCLNFAVTAWLYSQMLNISKLILHIFINKMKVLILIKMMHSSVAALIKSLWDREFNSSLSFMQNQSVDFNFTVNQSSRRNWAAKMDELKNYIKELFQYVQDFTYQYLCAMVVQKEIKGGGECRQATTLPKFKVFQCPEVHISLGCACGNIPHQICLLQIFLQLFLINIWETTLFLM